jgi:hypothetical protein
MQTEPERKRPLVKPGFRYEDNIKADLKGIGYEDMDWIRLDQGIQWPAIANKVVKFLLP